MTGKDKDKTERISLSKAHVELLRSEIARTGAGPQQILRGLFRQTPEGLSSNQIRNWAEGRTKTARRDHFDWVLALYAAYTTDIGMVPFTEAMQSELKREIRRSQTTPARLFRALKGEMPKGLQSHTVLQWSRTPPQNIREAHFNWVLSQYQMLPDKAGRIPLTPKMLAQLTAAAKRTGASGHTLLQTTRGPVPDGLTPVVVNRWLSGKTANARTDHWEFVLEAYAHMPAAPKGRQHVKLAKRIAISDEFVEMLQTWRLACLLPSYILRTPDAPPGLKPPTISNWLNGTSATALPDHLGFVASHCEAAFADPEFRVLVDKAARGDIRASWLSMSQTERAKLSRADCEAIESIMADTLFAIHPAELLRLRRAITA